MDDESAGCNPTDDDSISCENSSSDSEDFAESDEDGYLSNWDSWRSSELHPHSCVQCKKDFWRMKKQLHIDPYCINRSQMTENMELPLHTAIYCQHVKCVDFLINEGADVELENFQEKRPLEIAVASAISASSSYIGFLKCRKIIELLLNHGANINYNGRDFESTYYLSQIMTKSQNDELLKMFLVYGADTEDWEALRSDSLDYKTPLYHAIESLDVSASKLLFNYGAEVPGSQRLLQIQTDFSSLEPIPHVLAKKRCKKTALRMLHLYRHFGGSFTQHYGGRTVLEMLPYYSPNNEGEEDWKEFKAVISEYCTKPLSLFDLCRLSIRRYFGREFKSKIKFLPIPREIKHELKFKKY